MNDNVISLSEVVKGRLEQSLTHNLFENTDLEIRAYFREVATTIRERTSSKVVINTVKRDFNLHDPHEFFEFQDTLFTLHQEDPSRNLDIYYKNKELPKPLQYIELKCVINKDKISFEELMKDA